MCKKRWQLDSQVGKRSWTGAILLEVVGISTLRMRLSWETSKSMKGEVVSFTVVFTWNRASSLCQHVDGEQLVWVGGWRYSGQVRSLGRKKKSDLEYVRSNGFWLTDKVFFFQLLEEGKGKVGYRYRLICSHSCGKLKKFPSYGWKSVRTQGHYVSLATMQHLCHAFLKLWNMHSLYS